MRVRLLTLLFAGFAAGTFAQAPTGIGRAGKEVDRLFPPWLDVSGEYRARWEGVNSFRFHDGENDGYLLSRVRLDMTLVPRSWLSFGAQFQDSRVYWNQPSITPDVPSFADAGDLRLGWVEVRRNEAWRLRVGRQDFAYGERRIIGNGNWSNTARSFDAVRLFHTRKHSAFEMFASSVVRMVNGQQNHHIDGDNLHGFVFSFRDLPGKAQVEGLALWRLAPRVLSELGRPGKLNFRSFSVRGAADLNTRTHLNTELAWQTGRRSIDPFRAWAGHWRVARDLSGPVTARAVYDYSPGDRDPRDGRQQAFDVMYPTQHDKWGQADQVGWKNIHHLSAELEWRPRKGVRFEAKYHNWWLSSVTDGLYSANGVVVARDITGRSGRYVGREYDAQVFWNPMASTAFIAGVAWVRPGTFLQRTTPGAPLVNGYLGIAHAF